MAALKYVPKTTDAKDAKSNECTMPCLHNPCKRERCTFAHKPEELKGVGTCKTSSVTDCDFGDECRYKHSGDNEKEELERIFSLRQGWTKKKARKTGTGAVYCLTISELSAEQCSKIISHLAHIAPAASFAREAQE